MAATPGNQFWKLRSKHGRDKIFESPDLLWDAACEYFEWCEANQFKKAEAKTVNIGDYQSKVEIVELPVMRPFTIQGLCHYLDVNTDYLTDFKDGLAKKEDQESKDFSRIITRIQEVIFRQKFEGAAAGFLNANIIARDLGLSDKKEITQQTIEVNLTD